jgi:uncharacterized membrane protein YfcA
VRSTTERVATPGRVARTALLAFLAAGIGGGLFQNPTDPLLTVIPFVLVVLATSSLTAEVTAEAQRDRSELPGRWARTDTANVCVLALFSALLGTVGAVGRGSAPERTAATCFAVLYLLAGYFWRVRRKTIGNTEP